MSERFWITGVQLGCLFEFEKDKRKELIDKIIDDQFIGNFYTEKEQKEFKQSMDNFVKGK